MMKEVTIKWKDLKVGDIFPDGSKVLKIRDWDYQKCYILKMNGKQIIVGETHLLKCIIYDINDEIINDNLLLSKKIREKSTNDVDSTEWICAEDIFENFLENKIFMLDNDGVCNILDSIDVYDNGKPQKVRCITTNTGYYEINGFINHNCGTNKAAAQIDGSKVIMNTLDGFCTSPIIQEMQKCKNAKEMRKVLFEGLKKQYHDSGIAQDDFNIQMVAKKMTSYKMENDEIKPIKSDEERCIIMNVKRLGNMKNIFKQSELQAGYTKLTVPLKETTKKDALNEILR